jgi:hypothetical protein
MQDVMRTARVTVTQLVRRHAPAPRRGLAVNSVARVIRVIQIASIKATRSTPSNLSTRTIRPLAALRPPGAV